MFRFRVALVAASVLVVSLGTVGVATAGQGRSVKSAPVKSPPVKPAPVTTIVGSEILPGEPGYVPPLPPDNRPKCIPGQPVIAIYPAPCISDDLPIPPTTIPGDEPRDLPLPVDDGLACIQDGPMAAIYPSPCDRVSPTTVVKGKVVVLGLYARR